MSRGIDTNESVLTAAVCLAQAGYKFVCRYMGAHKHAPLTRAEAEAITDAGMFVVSIWEKDPTSAAYFSHPVGVQDGLDACEWALKCGQPSGSVIYFTVDYDASMPDITGPIFRYFEGVVQACKVHGYLVGVYGSGTVCNWLRRRKPGVVRSWLAESRGWSGYDPPAHSLVQSVGNPGCGITGDINISNGDAGGWHVAA